MTQINSEKEGNQSLNILVGMDTIEPDSVNIDKDIASKVTDQTSTPPHAQEKELKLNVMTLEYSWN
eukprot:7275488-Ditylum_brightwellii.AAC.2